MAKSRRGEQRQPMPICICRRGQPATMPAPNHAPATAAPIMPNQGRNLDGDDRDEDEGLGDRGQGVRRRSSVPGIGRSGTRPCNLKMVVVGAKEPIPSVSKKLVTKPIASWNAEGGRRSTASAGTWAAERAATAPRHQLLR